MTEVLVSQLNDRRICVLYPSTGVIITYNNLHRLEQGQTFTPLSDWTPMDERTALDFMHRLRQVDQEVFYEELEPLTR